MTEFLATLFLPLAGAIALLFVGRNNENAIKYITMAVSLLAFAASLFLWFGFDQSKPGFQFYIDKLWIPQFDAGFRVGLDGMSLLLVMLTTFMLIRAILVPLFSAGISDASSGLTGNLALTRNALMVSGKKLQ